MKRLFFVALLGTAALTAGPADAAKSEPSATIRIADSALHWGGRVAFDTTVSNVSSKATISDAVVCTQHDRVVYQWAAAPGFDFPLVQQSGLAAAGAVIDTSAQAHCVGSVRYQLSSGPRNVTILSLASVEFDVLPA